MRRGGITYDENVRENENGEGILQRRSNDRGGLLDNVLRCIIQLSSVVFTRGAAPVSYSANEPVFWCSQLITNSVSLGTSSENP